MIKSLLIIGLSFFFISCVDENVSIRYNQKSTQLEVLSDDYRITTLTLNAMLEKEGNDTIYSMLQLDKPLKNVVLNNCETCDFEGRPVNELLSQKPIQYVVILANTKTNNPEDIQIIAFTSEDVKEEENVFYSDASSLNRPMKE